MFTLTRLFSALLLGLFAYMIAPQYELLHEPGTDLGRFEPWVGGVGVVIGWSFLGRQIGQRALWFSAFVGAQAVALTGIVAAGVLAVREVFVLGYRMRYDNVTEAFTGYFDIVVNWLALTIQRDFLIMLGVGGLVLGAVLHLLYLAMERRRNDR